jgi:hypothetical protein
MPHATAPHNTDLGARRWTISVKLPGKTNANDAAGLAGKGIVCTTAKRCPQQRLDGNPVLLVLARCMAHGV